MWNLNISGLLVGATVVVIDGDPAYPDVGALWRLAEDHGVTTFGASAGYLLSLLKAGYRPRDHFDLSRFESIGSTGSPLPPEGFRWMSDAVGEKVKVVSTSGGTDVCTAFVGGSPLVPVWEGEISCRYLGMAVEAFDPDGARWWGRPVNSSLLNRCPRCRSPFGTTTMAPPTGLLTSNTSRVSGATETGSRSPSGGVASSPAAPTPPSTGVECGWAPPSSIQWSKRSEGWPTASSSTSTTALAARAPGRAPRLD